MTRVAKIFVKSLTTTVVFFLLAEIALRGVYAVRNAMAEYVPLPYAVGDNYGPMPPWLDAVEILQDDDTLFWKNKPSVRRTYLDVFSPVRTEADRVALLRRFTPWVPHEFAANPKWDVELNADGFRGGAMSPDHPSSTIRIACVGDSWTFGMPVPQNRSYPSRLVDHLQEARPAQRFEVLNFGVLGYSSFQGLRLMKDHVLGYRPDVVVIGFGMNDSQVAGYRDKDMAVPPTLVTRGRDLMMSVPKRLETYKLLKYEALVLGFKPQPMSAFFKDSDEGQERIDYDDLEPWTRVSPRDFEANIREMIGLARERGAVVVLLDNELWEGSPYRPILAKIADELRLPRIDSVDIIAAARAELAAGVERRLDLASHDALPAPPPRKRTVVFRVYRGSAAVPDRVSIVGADSQLGGLVPNSVSMHDDGKNGDQRAGDGVWSYAATLPIGRTVSYVYTNSGTRGRWEGLDVPFIRTVKIPSSGDGVLYLPVDTFGEVYMQGDHWHPNADGYDRIAQAVARAIVSLR